jgi:phenylalanyl-tRNA synthetase beta chain
MDIKIPHSLLKKYIDTKANPETIARCLTLCGPSIDKLEKNGTDSIYHVEIITNRIDSASAFGIAREASAILPQFGIKAKLVNNPYTETYKKPKIETKSHSLNIQILDQSLIPRFTAIILNNLTVKSSPQEIQSQLIAGGLRPINNLVDITNYLTLSLGQPCHIFDYHKIKNHLLKLRTSKKGETITTLDNRIHTLQGGDIVIEDGSGNLIDLCGVMGGKLSEVDEKTTAAILFIQTYLPQKIRRTSLYTQERTLAAQIFEKYPDPELVLPTIHQGIKLLQSLAGGKIASHLIDIYPQKPKTKTVTTTLPNILQVAGTKINPKQIISILEPLGLKSKITNGKLTCVIPSWRLHDLSIPEDIIEEIIRIYGYFKLPSVLPPSTAPQTNTNHLLEKEFKTKTILTHLGYTEVYHFSLVSNKLFQKSTLPIDHSIEILNPLTPDFQYLRRSLIPSLLNTLSENRGKVDQSIRIFELSHIYLNENQILPTEQPILTLATNGLEFFKTKGELEALLDYLKIENVSFKPLDDNSTLFNKSKTAEIYANKLYLGIIGQISHQVTNNFQLEGTVIVANLDFQHLTKLCHDQIKIKKSPLYPPIIENITIESKRPIGEIIVHIKNTPSLSFVKYLNSFHHKHTFEIHFSDPKRNLTQKEIEPLKEKIRSITR